jgi:hypothetical protein
MANTTVSKSSSFNSDEYAWKDITVQIGDTVLTGIQGVRYKETRDDQYVYGKGNKPLSIQEGNIAYDGSITILQNELQALEEAAPEGNILNYKNLQILVAYEKNDAFTMDIVKGAKFVEREKSFQQNAPNMTIELPIMFLDLQLNA